MRIVPKMTITDPRDVVLGLLKNHLEHEIRSGRVNYVTETMAHYLTGLKVSDYYRVDLTKQNKSIIAQEILRGVIADLRTI